MVRAPSGQVVAYPISQTTQEDGIWLAQLKSPPVDGKANAELISLLADYFGCRKQDVTIKAGAGARIKRVTIAD